MKKTVLWLVLVLGVLTLLFRGYAYVPGTGPCGMSAAQAYKKYGSNWALQNHKCK